jgi:stringent starvation protein B
MTSSRPYLIRALYEWIVDNGLTPYILVDAAYPDLAAPREYADNGKLVLNIAPRAVRALNVSNEGISFNARFGGTPRDVFVPVLAVLAIYARENGQGMLFSERDDGNEPPPDPQGKGGGRPTLRVVK